MSSSGKGLKHPLKSTHFFRDSHEKVLFSRALRATIWGFLKKIPPFGRISYLKKNAARRGKPKPAPGRLPILRGIPADFPKVNAFGGGYS